MVKPSVIFILIICIAGYYFYDSVPKTKLRLKRSSGYHTFLLSATGGTFLFVVSTFIICIFSYIFNWVGISLSLGHYILIDIFASEATFTDVMLFDTCCIAVVLSWGLPRYYYGDINSRRKHLIYELANDDEGPELNKLFVKSMKYGLPILFTMKDRKVYIGYIMEVHTTDFNDIFILPIFSGYRNKDDLTLVPVTPYQDVLDGIANDKEEPDINYEKFTVGLPLREISYAHLHDFNYYKKFKEKEENLKRTGGFGEFKYPNESANYFMDDEYK